VNVSRRVASHARRQVKGYQLVTIGTMDTVLVHTREIFRLAMTASATAIALMHNHPSGALMPSLWEVGAFYLKKMIQTTRRFPF
jgi:DNA repair protein RadC